MGFQKAEYSVSQADPYCWLKVVVVVVGVLVHPTVSGLWLTQQQPPTGKKTTFQYKRIVVGIPDRHIAIIRKSLFFYPLALTSARTLTGSLITNH